MMDREREIFKAQDQFEELVNMIRNAANEGEPIDQVERNLWQRLLAMGQRLLQGYVDLQGSGDMGESLEKEGKQYRRLEKKHPKRYLSVFGEIEILRTVYGTREKQKHEVVPLDARLNLPEGEFSYLLQEWDQDFCVQGSYLQATAKMERILGIGQSVRSLEHMNRIMAQDVKEFRDAQPKPEETEEGSLFVITADGKGVPIRRNQEKSETAIQNGRPKGEKANKKRQACVGSVYTIEPFPRQAEDVINEVMRKEKQAKRPSPCNKRMRAELTREVAGVEVNGKDVVFQWFAEEMSNRNPEGKKTVVCVMDADRALWKKLQTYVPSAVGILDLYHVLERLWDAAYCFYREGSEEAESFVTDRLTKILQGKVGRVIGGLKQMQTKLPLTKTRRSQLNTVIAYLENNRDLMQYDYYLACGYPIGSGVAEGACRHVVKDRMELTGMRWTVEGAQAMLDLRAVHLNGDWEAFHQHRIKRQQEKLYPYREEILAEWKMAA